MASPCIGLKATQPPSARAGLMVTPSRVNGQIGARKAVAVHVARYGWLPSEGVIDLLPVDFLSDRGVREGGREDEARSQILIPSYPSSFEGVLDCG